MVVNYIKHFCGISELHELETCTIVVKRNGASYMQKNAYQKVVFCPQNFFRSVNKYTFWFRHFLYLICYSISVFWVDRSFSETLEKYCTRLSYSNFPRHRHVRVIKKYIDFADSMCWVFDDRISGAIFKLDTAGRIRYFLTSTFTEKEVSAVCNFKIDPCHSSSWWKFNTQNR
jgi:hypothetical protein